MEVIKNFSPVKTMAAMVTSPSCTLTGGQKLGERKPFIKTSLLLYRIIKGPVSKHDV